MCSPRLSLLLGIVAVVVNGDDVRALIQQARVLANRGDAAGADAILIQAAAKAPDDPEPLLLRGNVAAFLLKEPSAGIELFRQSIAVRPTFEAHFFLGKALSLEQRLDEAAASFRAAASHSPKGNPAALIELGAVEERRGSWERAQAALAEAAAVDVHTMKPLHSLAQMAVRMGRLADAASAYRNVTELHPWHASPMLEFAELLLAHASARDGELGPAMQQPCPPTFCDLFEAGRALQPDVEATREGTAELARVCARPPTRMSVSELESARAAAASLKGGPCAMLVAHPALAPLAKEASGACILAVPAGATVEAELTGSGVVVPANATLIVRGGGAAATIDAGGRARHFVVAAAATLELDGVALTGGRALLSSGGSVLALAGSTLR